jgi:hypothetical protein
MPLCMHTTHLLWIAFPRLMLKTLVRLAADPLWRGRREACTGTTDALRVSMVVLTDLEWPGDGGQDSFWEVWPTIFPWQHSMPRHVLFCWRRMILAAPWEWHLQVAGFETKLLWPRQGAEESWAHRQTLKRWALDSSAVRRCLEMLGL